MIKNSNYEIMTVGKLIENIGEYVEELKKIDPHVKDLSTDIISNIARIKYINSNIHNDKEILDDEEIMTANIGKSITLKLLNEITEKKYKSFTVNGLIEFFSYGETYKECDLFIVSNFISIKPRCTSEQLIEYLKREDQEQKIKFLQCTRYHMEIHKEDEKD